MTKQYYTFAHDGLTSDTNIWFTTRQAALQFRDQYFNAKINYYVNEYRKTPKAMQQFLNVDELIDHVESEKQATGINVANETDALRANPNNTIFVNHEADERPIEWLEEFYHVQK